MKNLVIVESPAKTKSIAKYLGKDYEVVSSKGHIIDLPKSTLGIDTEHQYQPDYSIIHGKTQVVKDLKKSAKTVNTVYLATDLDREGEAIAWHIVSALDGLNEEGQVNDNDRFKRVVFSEITKDAIINAFKKPRGFDYSLIDAYQARRVLDRLVGYKLSPLLWKKIQFGLSAGRVQSVAMRLIVEREKERKAFKTSPYFRVQSHVTSSDENFQAELSAIDSKQIEQKHTLTLFAGKYTYSETIINTAEKLNEILSNLRSETQLRVIDVSGREVAKKPDSPFTTASLQRAGLTHLHLSARNTMSAAQKLYEGGYITYHRTDSTNLSTTFIDQARDYINKHYGPTYLTEETRVYKTKQKSAQEAHEAIRPTQVEHPDKVKSKIEDELGASEAKLYSLIWRRAVASQASNAKYRNDTLTLAPHHIETPKYVFTSTGSVIIFDGFLRISGRKSEDTIIPTLAINDLVSVREFTKTDHETTPPPRYNDASLVRDLEAHGIGRPSTYAPIIDTLQKRDYTNKENNAFVPTDIGIAVTNLLVDHFPEIVGLEFTADMENQFDEIASGHREWVQTIDAFYTPFQARLSEKDKSLERDDYKVIEELEEKCPDCGNHLNLKIGRYGKFYSCSNFPDCKYARPFVEKIGMNCPYCQTGDVIVRQTQRGKKFFGCSNYPNCMWAVWNDPRSMKPEEIEESKIKAAESLKNKQAEKEDKKTKKTSKTKSPAKKKTTTRKKKSTTKRKVTKKASSSAE
ncbi:type I DNA topoisomerase [candidate division WWE3 bacterium]|nr:type I DNA topoisomerase [candidate division WWE3 bacterium]